jgi:hypothetical protein
MQIKFIIKQIEFPKIKNTTIYNCCLNSMGWLLLIILMHCQCPLILNNIRLETRRYMDITELRAHMEKLLKHCFPSLRLVKLTLKLPSLVMEVVIMLLLKDRVVHITQAIITSYMVWTFHVLAGWWIIAHRSCSIPKARSTSFMQASFLWQTSSFSLL